MAISSQGATFAFAGFTAQVTSISVEDAPAEIVDMTRVTDALGVRRMVYTGDKTAPARVRVDYIRTPQTVAPLTMAGSSGVLSISHAHVSLSTKAIIETASSEIAVGQFMRGTLSFVVDNST